MRIACSLLLFAYSLVPAFAATPHSGVVERDGFELSDAALFVVAVAGVWVARRALRARFRKRRESDERD